MGTKHNILLAAEEIFSKKGSANATISEIANKAGVTDSVIYHHFKNKEDLIFSLTGLHLQAVLGKVNDQLEGILEPISKLSKMFWFHLHYNTTHREYSRLLLCECRSNPNFYHHKAYNFIRQYAGVMLDILEKGKKQGVFDEKVNMRIVRDIILGALDLETIAGLITPDHKYVAPDVLAYIETIKAMIEIRTEESDIESDKFMRILEAAETIFSEKGFAKSTILEIARKAMVAEGTVYEYFKNKEDLLLSIPKVRFREHIEATKELFKIKSVTRKLRRFIRYHFMLNMLNYNFLKILLYNIQQNPKFYSSEGYTILNNYKNIINKILNEGKNTGIIRSDLNNRIYKHLLFGGFSHMALRWLILEKEVFFDKMSEIDQFVDLMTRGAVKA